MTWVGCLFVSLSKAILTRPLAPTPCAAGSPVALPVSQDCTCTGHFRMTSRQLNPWGPSVQLSVSEGRESTEPCSKTWGMGSCFNHTRATTPPQTSLMFPLSMLHRLCVWGLCGVITQYLDGIGKAPSPKVGTRIYAQTPSNDILEHDKGITHHRAAFWWG